MNWQFVARHPDFVEIFLVCSYSQRTVRFFFWEQRKRHGGRPWAGRQRWHDATTLGSWSWRFGDGATLQIDVIVGGRCFSSDFFLGVGDIEKNAIYVWLKELVSHHLLGSQFFRDRCHVSLLCGWGCWVNSLSFAEVWVSAPFHPWKDKWWDPWTS